MSQRRILVTSALPYANGHIHLGHLVEYIQTDIWVRFQRLQGHECLYVCADDTHGTAIMNRARQEGRTEAAVIADMHAAHTRDFADFGVEFDNYGSTHCDENRELCGRFWTSLQAAGLVNERSVTQLFDPEVGTFLADRFVKGTCPNCKSPNQYGDNCDKCSATYAATELIDPVSMLSGATPVLKDAAHFFVNIEQLHRFLEEWTQTGDHLQPEIANSLAGQFLGNPLKDWDVSRPAPYFGFEIPGTNGQHYWYVWFDAPIGYISSTWQWCKKSNQTLERWWQDAGTEVHHFIGKDIMRFHTLFWPAMLKTAGYNLPRHIHIHGFLTVNGEKMSKSKGTAITARTYLKHLDPAYLRYYYASKLTNKVDDIDLNLEEFLDKVNADLVGKVVNLASRTARFVRNVGLSKAYPDDGGLFAQAAAASDELAAAYDSCDYNKAMRQIMTLADAANRYVEHHEPWKLKKDAAKADQLQQICTVALNLFRQIVIYLAPVLPKLAAQTGKLLGEPITAWSQAQQPLLGTSVNEFEHLLKRVESPQIEIIIQESIVPEFDPPSVPSIATPTGTSTAAPETADTGAALAAEPLAGTCSFDDFAKVDLRVARVLHAESVPESTKLLKLRVTLGGTEERTIFAGIQGVYDPPALIGQLVVIVANLAPRKMRFGTSEGMVVAAGPGGNDIFLLRPDEGAVPGQRVH